MNNNILLNWDNAEYEPHFWRSSPLPFTLRQSPLFTSPKSVPPNLHMNIELLYFPNGQARVMYGSEVIPVQAGDLVVVNPYVVHAIKSQSAFRYAVLIIDSGFCADNLGDLSGLRFRPLIRDGKVKELFEAIMEEYDHTDVFQNAAIRCAVLRLMLTLCRHYSEPKTQDAVPESIWTAVSYMKQNLHQKLTLEQIAASAGYSKYYFLRLFKARTGYTVTRYLTLLRCSRAGQLLQAGVPVNETAMQCGFESTSYFIKVFKTCTGVLPGDILRQRH